MPVDEKLDASVLERHRMELTGYCYRMLGAASEAEDAVQETLVRAWRSAEGFEGRAAPRTWLYRIAHNVCMDMHRSPQRRARPMEMGPATRTADLDLGDQLEEHLFLTPVPDGRVVDPRLDPAEAAVARESIHLAFVTALQHLPPRQRSVLILCEVLRWPAAEVADLLETTVASVNSALQRARATLATARHEPLDDPLDPDVQDLVARYVDAFERFDIDELVTLLRDDAVMSMPPWSEWIQGASDIGEFLLGPGAACRGDRLVPMAMNGCHGFGNYRPVGPGVFEPWGLIVVEVAGGRICGLQNFIGAARFAEVGLPDRLTA